MTANNASQWLPIIKSTYPEIALVPKTEIRVCELHFDGDNMINVGMKKNLIPGAVPNVRYVIYII